MFRTSKSTFLIFILITRIFGIVCALIFASALNQHRFVIHTTLLYGKLMAHRELMDTPYKYKIYLRIKEVLKYVPNTCFY